MVKILSQSIEEINSKLTGMVILDEIQYPRNNIHQEGDILRCYCPIHKESIFRSMLINERDKKFKCAYTLCSGHGGGDLLELYSLLTQNSKETSVIYWTKKFQLSVDILKEEDFLSELISKAENYISHKEIKDAIQVYKEIIHLCPDNIHYREILIDLLQNQNEIEQAAEYCLELGNLFKKQNDFTNAEKYYFIAIKLMPESDNIQHKLVEYYLEQQNIDEAIKLLEKQFNSSSIRDKKINILEKLISLEPDNIKRVWLLAGMEEENGAIEKAIEIYRKILTLYSGRISPLELRNLLNRLIKLEPDNFDWEIQLYLFDIKSGNNQKKGFQNIKKVIHKYTENKDYSTAAQIANQVKELLPNQTEINDILINILVKSDKIDDAIKLLIKCSENAFNDNNAKGAVNYLEYAVSIKENDTELIQNLIYAYQRLGKKDLAHKNILTLAELYLKNNQILQAIDLYKNALLLKPKDTGSRQILATLYENNSANHEAIDEYLILVDEYISNNNYTDAEDICRKNLVLDHENIATRERLIKIYRGKNDKIKEIEQLIKLAKIYSNQGDNATAKKYCRNILSHIKDHISSLQLLIQLEDKELRKAAYLQRLANIYFIQQNYHQAANTYRLVLQLIPENIKSMENLTESLSKINAPLDEIKRIQVRLSDISIKKKDVHFTVTLLDKLISQYPDDFDILDKYASFISTLIRNKSKAIEKKKLVERTLKIAGTYQVQGFNNKAISILEELIDYYGEGENILVELSKLYLDGNRRNEAKNIFEKIAQIQIEQGRHKELTETCKSILNIDENHIKFRECLAECYLIQGDSDAAIQEYHILAKFSQQSDKYDTAISNYQKILDIQGENVDILLRLSECYIRNKNPQKALDILDKYTTTIDEQFNPNELILVYSEILRIQPQNISVHEKLAKLFLSLGRTEQAIQEYDVLASSYRQQGKPDLAIQSYLTALNLEPQNIRIRKVIADTYLEMGMKSESIGQYYSIVQSLLSTNKYDETIELLNKILVLEPNHTPSQTTLAELYYSSGQINKSIPIYIILAEKAEKNKHYPEALAYLKKIEPHEQNNEIIFESLIRNYYKSKNSDGVLPYIYQYSDLLLKNNEYAKARDLLENSIRQNQQNMQLKSRLFLLYEKLGLIKEMIQVGLSIVENHMKMIDFKAADLYIDKLLLIEPDNIAIHNLRIQLYIKSNRDTDLVNAYMQTAKILIYRNNFEQAEKIYENALNIQPNNTKFRRQYIELLLKSGNRKKIIEEYEILSDIYLKDANVENALASLRQALALEPNNLRLQLKMVNLLKSHFNETDFFSEAILLAEKYFNTDETTKCITLLEDIITKNPSDIKLLNRIEKLIQQIPISAKTLVFIAYILKFYSEKKLYPDVVRFAEKIILGENNKPELLKYLAEAYIQLNEKEKAFAIYKTIVQIHQNNNNIPNLLKTYQAILSIQPHDIEIRKSYIEYYLQDRLEEEIIEQYLALCDAYLFHRQYAEALTFLDKVMKLDPTNADAYQKIQLLSTQQNEFGINSNQNEKQ